MKVGMLGGEKIGAALAQLLIEAGHSTMVSSRNLDLAD
jgi:predicted dinucleotide-binding enzyme